MGKGDGGRISRLKKASSKSFSYLMVLPAVLLFTLFAVYPFVEGIKLGFYRWDGLSPMTFIGMENYVNILHDEQYWSALKNTFLYAVVTTIAKNLLGLVLAMVMMKITHGKGFSAPSPICRLPSRMWCAAFCGCGFSTPILAC